MTISDPLTAQVAVEHEPYVDGFDAFVLASGSSLARTAYLLTGDRHLAEDLVQTALAKVSLRWDRIVRRGHPGAYVRTVLVRSAIGWRRRRWTAEVPMPMTTSSLSQAAVDDAMAGVDARDRLRRALLSLPPRQRAAIVLRFYEDRSETDAAALLGCSVGTVKSQTAKGLARLRSLLEPHD